jgi:hypothetical protein
MQKSLERYATGIDDIDTKTTDVLNATNCLKDNPSNYLDFLNPYLKYFSHNIISCLFNNIQYGTNNISLLDDQKDEKDVLKVITNVINSTITKLQS